MVQTFNASVLILFSGHFPPLIWSPLFGFYTILSQFPSLFFAVIFHFRNTFPGFLLWWRYFFHLFNRLLTVSGNDNNAIV